MIFVAGVSSSGKTYMLHRLAERRPDLVIVSGSRTLASLGRPLRPLTPSQASQNQWILLNELQSRGLLPRRDTLLDGHATIETTTGAFVIPPDWYDAAAFAGFIQVEADPRAVSERRSKRGLPWTEGEAADLQELERRELLRHSTRLGRPYLAVRSDDLDAVENWMEPILSSPTDRAVDR